MPVVKTEPVFRSNYGNSNRTGSEVILLNNPPLFQHCKKSYSDEEGQVKSSKVMCFDYHRL